MEKLIFLMGISFFLNQCPGTKIMSKYTLNKGEGVAISFRKFKKKIEILFSKIIFLYTWKDFIHSIWICYEKAMDNLVLGAIRTSF